MNKYYYGYIYITTNLISGVLLRKAIKKYGNNTQEMKQVAKALNIGIATLYRKVKKYNIYCKFNLIPFNPFDAVDFQAPTAKNILKFSQILQDAGFITTIRKTRGDDILAACGQLAGQVKDKTARTARLQNN